MPKYNMEEILPHKKPMIFIDDVINYDLDNNSIKTTFRITPDSILFDNEINGVDSCAGIEYMAQTIGAYSYFKNGMRPPKIGFLLGTRQYSSTVNTFEFDKTFIVEAKEIYTDNRIVSFECFIYNEDEEICAKSNINVYVPQDDEDIMGVLNG